MRHKTTSTIRQLAVTAAATLLWASSAQAADQAKGWKAWSDHAERILAAADAGAETGNASGVRAACDGTTRTIISQGFQFPYWAQMLPQFCGVMDQGTQRMQVSRRELRSYCRKVRTFRDALEKAQPVAVEPRAEGQAKAMAAILDIADKKQCKG